MFSCSKRHLIRGYYLNDLRENAYTSYEHVRAIFYTQEISSGLWLMWKKSDALARLKVCFESASGKLSPFTFLKHLFCMNNISCFIWCGKKLDRTFMSNSECIGVWKIQKLCFSKIWQNKSKDQKYRHDFFSTETPLHCSMYLFKMNAITLKVGHIGSVSIHS